MRFITRQLKLIRLVSSSIGKTALIIPTIFLVAMGINLISLGIIFYAREVFQLRPGPIGWLAAVYSLFYIFGCLFVQPVYSRIAPRYTILVSTLFSGSLVLLLTQLRSVPLLYVFYALFGFFTSIFWPPIMGWLSYGREGTRLNRSILVFNLSWSIPNVIGPLFAGLMSEQDPKAPLYASSVFLFTALLLVAVASILLPKIQRDRYIEAETLRESEAGDKSTLLRFPAWLGLFVAYAALGVVINIFPLYARYSLFFSKSLVGALLLSRALFGMFAFVLLGRTSFWHFKASLIIGSQFCLILILILMLFVRATIFYAVLFASLGFILALIYSISIFHGIAGSRNRSQRMAIHEALLMSGIIIGSSAGGMLYQSSSMSRVFLFCIILIAAGLLMQIGLTLFLRKRERQTA